MQSHALSFNISCLNAAMSIDSLPWSRWLRLNFWHVDDLFGVFSPDASFYRFYINAGYTVFTRFCTAFCYQVGGGEPWKHKRLKTVYWWQPISGCFFFPFVVPAHVILDVWVVSCCSRCFPRYAFYILHKVANTLILMYIVSVGDTKPLKGSLLTN